MFTGIVREVGVVQRLEAGEAGATLEVAAPKLTEFLELGASVAVDGVCVSVTRRSNESFAADLVPETMRRTRFAQTSAGSRVNLELPLRVDQFVDGHLVQGHVDGTGRVVERGREDTQLVLTVEAPPDIACFVAEKGSIAINGVSLTVTDVIGCRFGVALIPITQRETNLGDVAVDELVNLEVDLMARYVARLRSFEGSGANAPDGQE